jgi:hypothetical protein
MYCCVLVIGHYGEETEGVSSKWLYWVERYIVWHYDYCVLVVGQFGEETEGVRSKWLYWIERYIVWHYDYCVLVVGQFGEETEGVRSKWLYWIHCKLCDIMITVCFQAWSVIKEWTAVAMIKGCHDIGLRKQHFGYLHDWDCWHIKLLVCVRVLHCVDVGSAYWRWVESCCHIL